MAAQTNYINAFTTENTNSDYKARYQELLSKHQMILSQISHEIRNPVTLINSFLQLVESKHPELSGDYYWMKVLENMDFLKFLLGEFSDFNNSETLRIQKLDFAQLFCETIESSVPSLEAKDITVHINVKSEIPAFTGDRIKLKQLILNLVRNAGEAITDQGEICCTLKYESPHILMSIKDSGTGIPEEYKKDLFAPFVTHKQDGTGLGLAICERIVNAHGGTISFCSEHGKGTEFTVCFPAS